MDRGKKITPEVLVRVGVARKSDRIKVLGGGELAEGMGIEVEAHAFSASAQKKIEAAGGTVTVVRGSTGS